MENSDTKISTASPRSASQTPPSSTAASSSWFSSLVRSRSSNAMVVAPTSPCRDAGGFSGPVNNKHQFSGSCLSTAPNQFRQGNINILDLFIHSQTGKDWVAFKIGDYKQQVIFIGGLKEGILAAEYLEPLAMALEKEHWSLVQFLSSSSYHGYGVSSLKQDAMELDQLISYLIDNEDSHGVILLGHSTGCQDIVYYLGSINAACSRAVRAAILQAPVSDREYFATLPETGSMIELASTMINDGSPSDLMPRKAHPDAPITACRYHSLCARNGDDDMFSSDFSEDELKQKLGHMFTTPTLGLNPKPYVCRSCFPWRTSTQHIDKGALVERLCRAMGGAEKVEIERGNQSLSNRIEEAVQAIMEIVRSDGPKGCEDPWS